MSKEIDTRGQRFVNSSGFLTNAKPLDSQNGPARLPGPGWYRDHDREFEGGSEADDKNCTNAAFQGQRGSGEEGEQ